MDWECKERLRLEGHQRRPLLHGRTYRYASRKGALSIHPVHSSQGKLPVWHEDLSWNQHYFAPGCRSGRLDIQTELFRRGTWRSIRWKQDMWHAQLDVPIVGQNSCLTFEVKCLSRPLLRQLSTHAWKYSSLGTRYKKRRKFNLRQELYEHFQEPGLVQEKALNRRGQKRDRQMTYMRKKYPSLFMRKSPHVESLSRQQE